MVREPPLKSVQDDLRARSTSVSQRDAMRAQTMKAQAGLLETNLDYLLTLDELMHVLGTLSQVMAGHVREG